MKINHIDGGNFDVGPDFIDLPVMEREIVEASIGSNDLNQSAIAKVLAGIDQEVFRQLQDIGVVDVDLARERLLSTARQIATLRVNALKAIGTVLGEQDARLGTDDTP